MFLSNNNYTYKNFPVVTEIEQSKITLIQSKFFQILKNIFKYVKILIIYNLHVLYIISLEIRNYYHTHSKFYSHTQHHLHYKNI